MTKIVYAGSHNPLLHTEMFDRLKSVAMRDRGRLLNELNETDMEEVFKSRELTCLDYNLNVDPTRKRPVHPIFDNDLIHSYPETFTTPRADKSPSKYSLTRLLVDMVTMNEKETKLSSAIKKPNVDYVSCLGLKDDSFVSGLISEQMKSTMSTIGGEHVEWEPKGNVAKLDHILLNSRKVRKL